MSNQKTVGILFDASVFRGIPRKKTGTERIHLYNKAAKRLGINLLYTSLANIDFRKGKARGLVFRGGRWNMVHVPIPKAIHNRTMPFDSRNKRKLQALTRKTTVFNHKNRYSKLKVHRLLTKLPSLRPHVPETVSFSKPHMDRMMKTYGDLFVKPISGSIGKGVMSLTKKAPGRWMLQAARRTISLRQSAAYRALRSRIGRRPYLIQKGIPLARYRGRPFDLRVSVQRGAGGTWQVTGTVGKIAGRGRRVTNLGVGGKAASADTLYRYHGWNAAAVDRKVRSVSLSAAGWLGKRLTGLSDIGFDIGLDRKGKPFIIEMNGRDQRYSFKKAGMVKAFYRTYETPLAYAAYKLRYQ